MVLTFLLLSLLMFFTEIMTNSTKTALLVITLNARMHHEQKAIFCLTNEPPSEINTD
jgi:hypothetical protein